MTRDEEFMAVALQQAKLAASLQEVPVGALLVHDNQIIARAHNQPIASHDPTAHAEIAVLRQAAQQLQNYRLINTTLYVTLEPCCMCAGAIIHARVKRVVYGASDPKAGAAGSVFSILGTGELNHRVDVEGGVLAEQSTALLQAFFKARR